MVCSWFGWFEERVAKIALPRSLALRRLGEDVKATTHQANWNETDAVIVLVETQAVWPICLFKLGKRGRGREVSTPHAKGGLEKAENCIHALQSAICASQLQVLHKKERCREPDARAMRQSHCL